MKANTSLGNSFCEYSQQQIKRNFFKIGIVWRGWKSSIFIYWQMFHFEWICCLNKGQECSGILNFLILMYSVKPAAIRMKPRQWAQHRQISFSSWHEYCLENPSFFKKIYGKSRLSSRQETDSQICFSPFALDGFEGRAPTKQAWSCLTAGILF